MKSMALGGNLAMFAKRANQKRESITESVGKVADGQRIQGAKDDAAGLSVSTKLEASTVSLRQAGRNANDGISLVQTAEGSLESLTNIMIRLRELSVQAANEVYGETGTPERSMIMDEVVQLKAEYNRVTSVATFNDIDVLSSSDTISIQVGIDGNANDRIDIDLSSFAATYGAISALTLAFANVSTGGSWTVDQARERLDDIDSVITELSQRRANLGSLQNRFENAIAEVSTKATNLTAAQSTIIDLDYAMETTEMTSSQIQEQASVAALAQAKGISSSLLSLLS